MREQDDAAQAGKFRQQFFGLRIGQRKIDRGVGQQFVDTPDERRQEQRVAHAPVDAADQHRLDVARLQ